MGRKNKRTFEFTRSKTIVTVKIKQSLKKMTLFSTHEAYIGIHEATKIRIKGQCFKRVYALF